MVKAEPWASNAGIHIQHLSKSRVVFKKGRACKEVMEVDVV